MSFSSTVGLKFNVRFKVRWVQNIKKKTKSVGYINHMCITQEKMGIGAIEKTMANKSKTGAQLFKNTRILFDGNKK